MTDLWARTRPCARRVASAAVGLTVALLLAACSGGSGSPISAAVPSAGDPGAGTSTPVANTTPAADTTPAASSSPTATTPSVSPPPSNATNACALLSKSELTAALGKNPGADKAFHSGASSQCQYGSYQSTFVLVNLTPTRGRAGYDLLRKNPKVHNAAEVSGIGDRAFTIGGPNTVGIYFNKGDALVLVMVAIGGATSPPRRAAVALAKDAVARV